MRSGRRSAGAATGRRPPPAHRAPGRTGGRPRTEALRRTRTRPGSARPARRPAPRARERDRFLAPRPHRTSRAFRDVPLVSTGWSAIVPLTPRTPTVDAWPAQAADTIEPLVGRFRHKTP